MSYSNPTTATYRFPAATLSAAAIVGRIVGPTGLQGRLVDVASVVTTGVTVLPVTVNVGTTGAAASAGTATIPVSAINAVSNGAVGVVGHVLAADTVVEVSSGGECTAGAADLLVTIDWF